MRTPARLLPMVAAAGMAAVLLAMPGATPGQGATHGDGLFIANMVEPASSTSRYQPCMCPICTSIGGTPASTLGSTSGISHLVGLA